MTLILNGTDNSATTPAVQGGTAGTTTGVYYPATNQVAISTNGTQAMLVNASQNTTFAGTLATSSRGIAAASMPAGTILQVVNATTTSTTSTTSNSFVDTNLTATITPTSSTSKIFVIMSTIIYFTRGSASGGGKLQLVRGATNLITQTDSSLFMTAASVASIESIVQPSVTYLDSPATTSATTYKMQVAANTGTTIYFSWNSNASFLTLMEVAA